MRGRTTIVEVAQRLGVSPSTVSRAFNEPRLLRAETVSRVRETAAEMGYAPNQHARALITGRAGAIGLAVPDITNPFFPPLIRAAQREAERQGLGVFVVETDSDPAREDTLINRLLPQVEGLLLASSRLPAERLREFASDTRLVLINRDVSGIPRVLISASEALEQAVRAMHASGAVNFCYVGGPHLSWSEGERRATIEALAESLHLTASYVRVETGTYGDARTLAPEIVGTGAAAVVAFDDVIAHGVLDGLSAMGVRVPGDILLLGCDDALPIETHPRISTIRLQTEAGVRTAVEMLLSGADSENRVMVPGQLRLRETT